MPNRITINLTDTAARYVSENADKGGRSAYISAAVEAFATRAAERSDRIDRLLDVGRAYGAGEPGG